MVRLHDRIFDLLKPYRRTNGHADVAAAAGAAREAVMRVLVRGGGKDGENWWGGETWMAIHGRTGLACMRE